MNECFPGNTKVLFGLVDQGHIPVIQSMLKNGKSWDDIGKQINWCPITAEKHYVNYLIQEVK